MDINRAAGVSQVEEGEKRYFSMLPVGQGIVKLQDRWRRPFLVGFPLVEVQKGAVTDDILLKYIKGEIKRSALRQHASKDAKAKSYRGTGERLLDEDEFRFLHDVLQHPEDGVKARYKRLSFSVDRGNKAKERLLNRSWLYDEIIQDGKTRTVKLTIPVEAEAHIGKEVKDIPAQFVIHEYWKRHYAAIFLDNGYEVEMEAPRKNGRVDVLARKAKELIGIEIETGKSDVVSNVRNGLASKFDKVFVVATDDRALEKVERELAKAGLLIPSRVEIVLRDHHGLKNQNDASVNSAD